MASSILREEYEAAKQQCSADAKSPEAGAAILRLAMTSLNFLVKDCQRITLVSLVPGKEYFTFKKGKVVARPANKQFFLPDPDVVARFWKKWLTGTIASLEFVKLTYTIALAPCLAME